MNSHVLCDGNAFRPGLIEKSIAYDYLRHGPFPYDWDRINIYSLDQKEYWPIEKQVVDLRQRRKWLNQKWPDIEFDAPNGEKWGVELTEIVHSEGLAHAKRKARVDPLWVPDCHVYTKQELVEKLIERFNEKSKSREHGYDELVLLLHTGETSIDVAMVEASLSEAIQTIRCHEYDRVAFMLAYQSSITNEEGHSFPVVTRRLDRRV